MNETTKTQGLGMAVIERRGEVAISAMAAKAKAEVEAKFTIALHRPRDIMNARALILDACKRPRFAESARYRKPVGKKQVNGKWEQQFIDGFSIRFAEAAIQAMHNISVSTSTIWEDADKRTVHISVVDLESNLSYGKDITIEKTVERKVLKQGQESLAERVNSYGDKVFIVSATEDEVSNKIAAQESKVIRNGGLRLIPQDILDEAEEQIFATLENGGSDPTAESKKIADAFNGIGIKPSELVKYLGHDMSSVTKKELNDLRGIFAAVRDGEATWTDYLPTEGNPDGAPKFVPKTPKPETKPETPKAAAASNEPAEKPQKPQDPVAPANVMPSTETAPVKEKPAQTPAAATGWRDFSIPGRSPDWSGKTLGSLTPEQVKQCNDEYVLLIEMARATAPQKMLKAQVALAMAELFPKPETQDLPLAEGFDHVKALNDLITQNKWDAGFFVQTAKMNGWVAEGCRKVADISPAEYDAIESHWDSVETEMAKAHQPAQQP